ncbi:MAG TPA: cellulase family glycosylhydrolase [Rariglobus sp.]|nr:cellulase family glycosylhydrolase [Rariglobus sp.]
MSWTCTAFAAGEVLWRAPMEEALRVELADKTTSALRTMDVPVETLRGKWVYLSAKVKGADISVKPQDWNGVKVMLKIDGAAGDQWPQIGVPAGSFDWKKFSTRILIPKDATKLTLHLGLELVTGTVWFDDVRITLARETRDVPAASADQPIFKGHGLPALRGAMAHPEMKREDLRVFAKEWGGNLIRWQLLHLPKKGSEKDYEAYDRWLDQALMKLDDVLRWSKEFGVKVVVDLHSPPGGRIASEGAVAVAAGDFWSTAASQAHFLKTWRRIAERYKGEHDVIWGFDLLNEPDDRTVTEAGDDWQTLADKAARAVREVDPRRTLIVEPAMWGSADGFIGFEPFELPNVVYSFHMYTPFHYTHQGVDGPAPAVTYPGEVDGSRWDKAALEKSMEAAIAFAKKHRVQMYVGEFSTIRWAPGAEAYLGDAIEIYEKYGWDWSYHAYREWHGWNLELGPDRDNLTPDKTPNARLKVLLHGMSQNQPAP